MIVFAIALIAFAVTHLSPIPGGLQELLTASGGQPILDTQPSFTSEAVYQRLDAFGEAGRALYQRFTVTTDIVFPLSLLTFLYFLARFTTDQLKPAAAVRVALLVVPFVWLVLDMVENASIYSMLSHYPERQDFIAANLGYLTQGKRAALMASLGMPVLLWLVAGVRRWRARGS